MQEAVRRNGVSTPPAPGEAQEGNPHVLPGQVGLPFRQRGVEPAEPFSRRRASSLLDETPRRFDELRVSLGIHPQVLAE